MNAAKVVAIALIAAGALGLVYHRFTYTRQAHEARLGSLALSVQHRETVHVPDWVSVGAIIAGTALLLFGGRKP